VREHFCVTCGQILYYSPEGGETLFAALLAQWQTPDADALAPLLLAACDRHTHQASKTDEPLKSGDTYYPFEVLAVLRLRLQRGLTNPLLEHSLGPGRHTMTDQLALRTVNTRDAGFNNAVSIHPRALPPPDSCLDTVSITGSLPATRSSFRTHVRLD
jgi:hypothetical protein